VANTPIHLDDPGHLVSGVRPAATSLAEVHQGRDEAESGTRDAHEESPVEHDVVLLEADRIVLGHESSVQSESNTDTDCCRTHQEGSTVKVVNETVEIQTQLTQK